VVAGVAVVVVMCLQRRLPLQSVTAAMVVVLVHQNFIVMLKLMTLMQHFLPVTQGSLSWLQPSQMTLIQGFARLHSVQLEDVCSLSVVLLQEVTLGLVGNHHQGMMHGMSGAGEQFH